MTTSEKKEISIEEALKDANVQIAIFKDLLEDIKRDRRNKLTFFIFIIVLLISFFCYIDFSNKSFLSQYSLGTEAGIQTTATDSTNPTNNGNINIGK